MTQAFNLSQLANNVNTSGLLNAAAGLYNQVPIANGGTGRSSVTSGNLLLGAGTSAMTELTGGTVGNVVTWNGSAWGSAAGSGGALQTFTVATTPGTWTKPATIKGIKVTVVGGGGTGGTAIVPAPLATMASGSGGGGGGGTSIRLYPAPSIPGPQPFTVGGAGATSSFGGTVTVISATGGANGTSAPGGGIASTAFITAGGSGGVGSSGNANIGGGAGGSGTASTSPGSPNNRGIGGAGGSTYLGGGGVGILNGTGSAGGSYGAGGAGGGRAGGVVTGTAPGGAGASGVVIIEEFY